MLVLTFVLVLEEAELLSLYFEYSINTFKDIVGVVRVVKA